MAVFAFFTLLLVTVSASSPVAFLVQNDLNARITNCPYASVSRTVIAMSYFTNISRTVMNQNLDPTETIAILDMAKKTINERIQYELQWLENAKTTVESQYNQALNIINFNTMMAQQASLQNGLLLNQPTPVLTSVQPLTSVFQSPIHRPLDLNLPSQDDVLVPAATNQERLWSFTKPVAEERIEGNESKLARDQALRKENARLEALLAEAFREKDVPVQAEGDDSGSLKSLSDSEEELEVVDAEKHTNKKRKRNDYVADAQIELTGCEVTEQKSGKRRGRPVGSKNKSKSPGSSKALTASSSSSLTTSSEEFDEERVIFAKPVRKNKKKETTPIIPLDILEHNLIKNFMKKK